MSDFQHFEELWEACENIFSQESATSSQIIEELTLKIGLYKAFLANQASIKNESANIKSRLFGEMLLTLSQLSLQENVNVFEALQIALKQRTKA